MRVFVSLACVMLAGACEHLVGIEEPLPAALADSGVSGDAGDAAPSDGEAGPDGSLPLEMVPCDNPCTCSKEPVAGAEDEVFKDVLPNALEAKAVAALHAAGTVSGCESNPPLFCPACNVSRGTLVTWLIESLGVPLQRPGSPTFPDVPKNHPLYAHIETAFELKIATGFPDGTFRPNVALTRGAAAVITAKALGLEPVTPSGFSDVSGWWAGEIEALRLACVTAGCTGDGTEYCPSNPISRRAAAVMVARGFNLVARMCVPGIEPPT